MTAALTRIITPAYHYLKGEAGIIPLQAEPVRIVRCGGSSSLIYMIPAIFHFMEFFNSAVDVLQTLVIALGAGLAIWGVINLLGASVRRAH